MCPCAAQKTQHNPWPTQELVNRNSYIRPTEEWMQAIYGAIEGADTFVFVLTSDSVASDVCGREIAHAATHRKQMILIVARDVHTNVNTCSYGEDSELPR